MDRVAYVNHDIDDALRAGVLVPDDLPAEPIAVLGGSGSQRIDVLVHDMVEASEIEGEIAQGPEAGPAMDQLRDFMFEHVYMGPQARAEHGRIERVITTLFDHYAHFSPRPAAYFVLDVVRRPSPDHATVLGGGWIASGPAGDDRVPTPWWPEGLELIGSEGAGEVQTPLTGPGARGLQVGDRVWFRHAKAGELCERVTELHLVQGGTVTGATPTYRGEGRVFV